MSIVRFLARPLLASSFVVAGAHRLKNAQNTAERLSPVLRRAADALPVTVSEKTLARVVGGAQLGSGVMLAAGKAPRISAALLTITGALNAAVEWRNADISTPDGRTERRRQLLRNLSLTGGVLLATVDTAGKPGLAWRAKRAGSDAAKTTRRQLAQGDKAVRHAAESAVRAVSGA